MSLTSLKLIVCGLCACFFCVSNSAIAQVKIDAKSPLKKYVDKYMVNFGKKGVQVPKADRSKAKKSIDSGWLAFNKMDYPSAYSNFFQAIQADRQYAPGYFGVAFLCGVRGQLDDAVTFYREALKYEKKFPPIYCNLAKALHLRDETNPEIPTLYLKAIEVNPKYVPAYLNCADYLAEKGDWAKAGELANQAVKQGGKINPAFKEEFKKHGIKIND